VVGLIDDDTNEDAIVSISSYNGQFLATNEHLILIKTNGKFKVTNEDIENKRQNNLC
jgi:hypothetical protein